MHILPFHWLVHPVSQSRRKYKRRQTWSSFKMLFYNEMYENCRQRLLFIFFKRTKWIARILTYHRFPSRRPHIFSFHRSDTFEQVYKFATANMHIYGEHSHTRTCSVSSFSFVQYLSIMVYFSPRDIFHPLNTHIPHRVLCVCRQFFSCESRKHFNAVCMFPKELSLVSVQ